MILITDPHSQKRNQFINLVMKYVNKGSGSSLEFLNSQSWTYAMTNLNDIIKQAALVVVDGVATRLYMPWRGTFECLGLRM
jgi:UDP-N-acetyl-D-mannosaminuronic acid transferase (WecB/TagA/CpsF family)